MVEKITPFFIAKLICTMWIMYFVIQGFIKAWTNIDMINKHYGRIVLLDFANILFALRFDFLPQWVWYSASQLIQYIIESRDIYLPLMSLYIIWRSET